MATRHTQPKHSRSRQSRTWHGPDPRTAAASGGVCGTAGAGAGVREWRQQQSASAGTTQGRPAQGDIKRRSHISRIHLFQPSVGVFRSCLFCGDDAVSHNKDLSSSSRQFCDANRQTEGCPRARGVGGAGKGAAAAVGEGEEEELATVARAWSSGGRRCVERWRMIDLSAVCGRHCHRARRSSQKTGARSALFTGSCQASGGCTTAGIVCSGLAFPRKLLEARAAARLILVPSTEETFCCAFT